MSIFIFMISISMQLLVRFLISFFHYVITSPNLGNFIYQNYRQALEKIGMNRGQLDLLEARLGTTAADYESDLLEEQKYFKGLRAEPRNVMDTVEYIELLTKLHVHKYVICRCPTFSLLTIIK